MITLTEGIFPGYNSLHLADLVAVCLLTVYTVLSVVNTVKPRFVYRKFGHLSRFVPQYNFFAPDTGIAGYKYAYRDQLSNGDQTDWEFVEGIAFKITLRSAIWNPKRVTQKSLDVMVYWLLAYVNHNYSMSDGRRNLSEIDGEISHFSHRMLVEFAKKNPHHEDAVQTQFLITQPLRSREDEREMLKSRWYTLPDAGDVNDS